MGARNGNPSISVIVPTRNRAPLLRASLRSLARQTLARHAFEVVVVDDGSSDDTPMVCERAAARMNVRYVRIEASGIGAAKNAGIFVSAAPVLFFFDDDDLANADLLEWHLETHRAHPGENVAALGYTTWAPALAVTRVMHYVTDVGGFQFCYEPLRHGQWLDFTYFWGGRSSCKRALLTEHGIFNQAFTFGCEDIELAYRLTRFELRVIHNRHAVQYMNRTLTYDEFCARCERQGRSQWAFSQLHQNRRVQEYCQVIDAAERWSAIQSRLASTVQRTRELEAVLADAGEQPRAESIEELYSLYRFTFDGFKVKGIVEASREHSTQSRC